MATDWKLILYSALATPLGIVVAVSDVEAAKQQIYRTRASTGDPSLACLQLRTSPDNPTGEIWLVKGPSHGPQS
jgi:hypothetical protein